MNNERSPADTDRTNAPQRSSPLLEARRLSKRFPGVQALTRVSLVLHPGEVLAVIGENGAGKSTLMKILAGVEEPDEGQILLDGAPVRIDSVRAAERRGIALIHQELNLADNLDVAACVFLGREPHRFGFVQRARLASDASRFLAQVGLDCSPDTRVGTLSPGRQQMVEIARALSTNARVLIMDEPTSSLSQGETEQLYRVIKDLRNRGVGIVYISHRLGEVKELADRVVVLRDGANAGELSHNQITHDEMVRLMVGRDLAVAQRRRRSGARPAPAHPPGVGESDPEFQLDGMLTRERGDTGHAASLLDVRGLRTSAHPRIPLEFGVDAGEIVGMAGLVGAGRTEVLRALFGIDRAVGGEIRVAGKPLRLDSPRDAIRAGLALVPEDRKNQGVILEMAVRENTTLPSLWQHARLGFRNRLREDGLAESMTRRLGVKTPNLAQFVQYLSGGNQQKVVLAKWLALEPGILLLDEPTRGIDVGAKQEIYRLVEDLADRGVAILFVSGEMEELLRLSDRALVMYQGRITGELGREQLSEEAIMRLATGG